MELRRIAHIDMDCFYAAVEIRDRPELAEHPVAVGGTSRRGVLTTCNYVARKFGVRSAMPVWKARELCPGLRVLPTRFERYREVSSQIRDVFSDFTELVEPLSLDEAYLDLSHHRTRAADLALMIRRRIREETGLTASAGVAPNKLLAKIASDWNKPDGQCVIPPSRVQSFMIYLPVRKIWGVGPKGEEKLRELGIETCGQLQGINQVQLVEHFGTFGLELYRLCRGQDDRPVVASRERKSLSNERTFATDLLSLEDCRAALATQFRELLDDLAASAPDRSVQKIFVKLKFSDFQQTTVETTARQPELAVFNSLLEEAWGRSTRNVRLLGLGVRFAETASGAPRQLELSI